MTARKADEDIFQAGLPGREVQQFESMFLHGIKQRWNRVVRLANRQVNEAVVLANGFDSRQLFPKVDGLRQI